MASGRIRFATPGLAGRSPGVRLVAAAPARAGAPSEHQVKAAFLYNFANFVEWPDGALGPAGSPLKVCVVGADPFGGALDDAFRDQVVQGRTRADLARRRRWPRSAAATSCSCRRASRAAGRSCSRSCGTAPTLTVADGPPLVRQGGMVNFVIEAKRVRFEINRGAAEHAGLRISSKLLALARIVESA